MQLTLTPEEASIMQEMLRSYLPGLRREAAATDLPSRELRMLLHRRIDLCERLLDQLDHQHSCTAQVH